MESTAAENSSVDLSYYVAVLRRRWKLAVIGVLIGTVAGGAFLAIQPKRATASALVNVNPIADNAFSSSRSPSDLLVPETEQAMARSTEVVTSVAALSPGDVTAADVRANTLATLMPDSTVLRIDYTASTAAKAVEGAQLVSQEYLIYRSSVAQERIDLAVDQLDKRSKKLDSDLKAANRDAAAVTDGPVRSAAEARAQSIQADLTSVNSQVNQLRAISTSGGTVISDPDPDRVTHSPNAPLLLFSGFLGGVLLALVLPFIANALDRRVRDEYDVARAGGGDVVARLDDPAALVPAENRDADQIRGLRERLMAVVTTPSPVFVVSDVGDRGARPSDLAANLAVLVADAGRDTTLVLADYPDDAFGSLIHSLGLVEGRFVHGARHFHSRVVTSLMVVTPAPYVDRLSIADVVAGLLQDERRRGSVTVVGVASAGGHSVRLTAARLADQVVLAVPRVDTRKGGLQEVVDELRAVGAPLHGTVLVHGDRVLTGDAALVPKHPLAGRGRERKVEETEDHAETDEQSELLMFSPWFYRAPVEAVEASETTQSEPEPEPEPGSQLEPEDEAQPEPEVKSEAQIADEPETESADPEPETADPEPETSEPDPETAEPDPETAEPEPVASRASSWFTAPEPKSEAAPSDGRADTDLEPVSEGEDAAMSVIDRAAAGAGAQSQNEAPLR